jgi:preprotein translocase subunit Sss1
MKRFLRGLLIGVVGFVVIVLVAGFSYAVTPRD